MLTYHTVAQQYAGSACSARKVKVKAEAAYWGGLLSANIGGSLCVTSLSHGFATLKTNVCP